LEATPCGLGKFRLVGADVAFNVKDVPARLKPKPPLLGTHWSKKLVEHMPEYGRAAKKYKPDAGKVKALAENGKEARVQIFFGTWCSFCTRFLPNTLKLEEELKKAGGKVTFEFHGLPPPPAAWSTREALQMRVRRLPTGLVFVDGKMIGRLEGNEWIRPEASLSRVIK
jgi:thiol-disulfide isomerase/thioredoxin